MGVNRGGGGWGRGSIGGSGFVLNVASRMVTRSLRTLYDFWRISAVDLVVEIED